MSIIVTNSHRNRPLGLSYHNIRNRHSINPPNPSTRSLGKERLTLSSGFLRIPPVSLRISHRILTMPVKFIDKFKVGFQAIIEAETGHLLGGRMVDDGPVFDTLFHALSYMTVVMDENVKAHRSVKLGKVIPFEEMVSCFVNASHD